MTDRPLDWWALLFALLCIGFAGWWMSNDGDIRVAAGFGVLAVLGVAKWWWGRNE